MKWIAAFFSDWLSPFYVLAALLLGGAALLVVFRQRIQSVHAFLMKNVPPLVRFVVAIAFLACVIIELSTASGALAYYFVAIVFLTASCLFFFPMWLMRLHSFLQRVPLLVRMLFAVVFISFFCLAIYAAYGSLQIQFLFNLKKSIPK